MNYINQYPTQPQLSNFGLNPSSNPAQNQSYNNQASNQNGFRQQNIQPQFNPSFQNQSFSNAAPPPQNPFNQNNHSDQGQAQGGQGFFSQIPSLQEQGFSTGTTHNNKTQKILLEQAANEQKKKDVKAKTNVLYSEIKKVLTEKNEQMSGIVQRTLKAYDEKLDT